MFYNVNHSKERRRFVKRAAKCAQKICKRLDKIVLISRHHKYEAVAEDATKIFSAIERSIAEAKEQMEAINETN
jgi:ribosomal protein S19E (S16A)